MNRVLCLIVALFILFTVKPSGYAQGTAFTYQGRLTDGGTTRSGTYDLRFTIYDALSSGSQVSRILTNAATGVSNGLFVVTLDFGPDAFKGLGRWLEIGVRTNGSVSNFTPLTPRQPITATPYAIFSGASGSLSNGVIQNPFFLGTTGSTPLELMAGSQRALRLEPNVYGAPNVIGGASVNYVDPGIAGATIGGGGITDLGGTSYSNRVSDFYGTVGGGVGNFAQGFGSTVSGGILNSAQGNSAVIAGGYFNRIQAADYAAISGGQQNIIQTNAQSSYIAGGSGNLIQANASLASIGGGEANTNGAGYAVVGGGHNNVIEPFAWLSVIGGGWLNYIQGGADQSVIAGGNANKVYAGARDSFAGGGFNNAIGTNADGSVLGGGYGNSIGPGARISAISGGFNNAIQPNSATSFIGGGGGNSIGTNSSGSTIGGGSSNAISNNAPNATIAGGFGNIATNRYATVGGGYQNLASGNFNVTGDSATVAGGYQNAAVGNNSVVAGGWANYARGDNSAVAGGGAHTNLTGYGFIGGGFQQTIEPFSRFSVIAGGESNAIRSNSTHAVIAGGQFNSVGTNAPYATIAGGSDNLAAGTYSFAAGRRAKANHQGTFVWADSTNADFASSSSNQFLIRASGGVGIGVTNPAVALEVAGTVRASAFEGGNAPVMFSSTGNQPLEFKVNGARALRLEPTASIPNIVGGFSANGVSSGVVGATIAGGGALGSSNTIGSSYSAVGGGYGNVIESNSVNTTIAGGRQNRIGTNAFTATIAGGDQNIIEGGSFGATIAGGSFNDIQPNAQGATISGGAQNLLGTNADYSVIAGGFANTNLGYSSTLGGGINNRNMGASYSVIAGGSDNVSEFNSLYTVVGGGRLNQVGLQSFACSILSGYGNNIRQNADSCVIAGGRQNQIDQLTTHAAVLGGSNNVAHGNFSSVGGGLRNSAAGIASMVPGGSDNSALGDYSFAAGRRAVAAHQGCFVWADSQNADFLSTANDQFSIRAAGGVRINGTLNVINTAFAGGITLNNGGAPAAYYIHDSSGERVAFAYADGPGAYSGSADAGDAIVRVLGGKLHLQSGGGAAALTVALNNNVGLGTTNPTAKLHVIGNIFATGTITPNSDRNAKTDFAPVDTGAVLERVAKLPIQQWRFKTEAENVKHVGPMAQDFRAAFGLGAHETAIATVDADGVALAAIQGLHQMVKDKDAKIAALEERLAKVERLLSQIAATESK